MLVGLICNMMASGGIPKQEGNRAQLYFALFHSFFFHILHTIVNTTACPSYHMYKNGKMHKKIMFGYYRKKKILYLDRSYGEASACGKYCK